MSIKANIKVGGATIQIESDTQAGLIEAAGFWGDCPDKCGNCKSPNIHFFSRTPGGNLYVGMKCHDCNHSLNFGQNKEPKGNLYIKQDEPWQPPYQGGNGGGNQTKNYGDDTQGRSQVDDTDDIPY